MSRTESNSKFTVSRFVAVAATMAECLEARIANSLDGREIPAGAYRAIDELFRLATIACRRGLPTDPTSDGAACYGIVSESIQNTNPQKMTTRQLRMEVERLHFMIRLLPTPLPHDGAEYPAFVRVLEDIEARGEAESYSRRMGADDDD